MKVIKYFFQFTIIISLFSIFKIIGLKNASNLGAVLGEYIGPLFRSKKLVRKNIETAYGILEKENEEKIIKNMWSTIGRNFAEYIHLKTFYRDEVGFDHIKINGKNYLDEIKKNNNTAIFVSGHFSNFELIPMELQKFGIKLGVLYRPLNNFFLDPLLEYLRMKYTCPVLVAKSRIGTREIVKLIKNGYSIALAADQRVGEGSKVPFFNKTAQTTTIPAQLAIKYNCKLVPVHIERKNNLNFEITVYEPLKVNKTGNDDEDKKNITIQLNEIIEKMIKKNPGQWLWSHNRWKQ